MYKVAICDDESLFLDHLVEITGNVMRELHAICKLTAFTDGMELLQTVRRDRGQFDLILMDILMEPVNGFALAKQMRELGCNAGLLFVTSTDTYSLEGYSLYPVQYLMKPVTKRQLFEAISRDYRDRFLTQHVFLPLLNGYSILPLEQVFYLETLNRKTYVRTAGGSLEMTEPMRRVLERLPRTSFARCHKSYSVNLHKVSHVGRTAILLADGRQIPVGRAFYDSLLLALIDCLDKF